MILPMTDPETGVTVQKYWGVTNKGVSFELEVPPAHNETYKIATEQVFAGGYNSDTLEPIDPAQSNHLSAIIYNNYSNVTTSPAQVRTAMQSGADWVDISNHIVEHPAVPGLRYNVKWSVVTTTSGTKHLISYDPTSSEQLEQVEALKNKRNMDMVMRASNSDTGIKIHQLPDKDDINGINEILEKDKAESFRPLLEKKLEMNPYGETNISKTNVTLPNVQEAFELIYNNAYNNDEE